MTDVPFAAVSGDASARPLHPSRLCWPAPTKWSLLFAAIAHGRFWHKADMPVASFDVRFRG